MLYYNKLYQSLKKVSAEWHAGHLQITCYWNYIKFFEDGTVIEASINSDNLRKISSAFEKDSPNITRGSFAYDGEEIQISLNGSSFTGGTTLDNDLLLQNQENLSWDLYNITDI
jgi:hypothetical protein